MPLRFHPISPWRVGGGNDRFGLFLPGMPLVGGDAFVSGTVSVLVSGSGPPYQWYRDGVAIPGETGSSYVLVDADEGTDITVKDSMGTESNALVQPTIPAGLIAAWEVWNATPDINGQLDTCPDRSGNGNTSQTLASSGSKPAIAASASFNNQAVATMAGTAGHILRKVTFTQGDIAQPYDVYWVGIQTNLGGTRQQWDSGGDASKRAIGYKLPAGFAISSVSNLTGGDTSTSPVVYGGRYDSTIIIASALYENDPATPKNTGDSGNRALSGLSVAGNNGTTPYSETLAGIFVAPGMSESERRLLFAYIYWRWKVGVAP